MLASTRLNGIAAKFNYLKVFQLFHILSFDGSQQAHFSESQ